MSESQSRYSIVERLTKSKLDIMEEGVNLKDQVKIQESNLVNLKAELTNWKEAIQEQIKAEERTRSVAIDRAEREIENLRLRVEEKEKIVKEKIDTIDKALASIEEISKTSPTINK